MVVFVGLFAVAACGGGCTDDSGSGTDHEVSLYHCGVDPTRFDGRLWRAKPVPFDDTNKPEDFEGSGKMTLVSKDEARFVDSSGATIRFVPIEEGWEPPPCL